MGYNSKYKSSEIEGILDSVGGKQDAIADLDTIRSGAAKGATALQSYTEKYTGTITGIKMNGASKGTSGVVDLGTVITAHQDISGKADKSSLATVATSGSYNDLSNKPTIPSAVTESTVSGWGFTKNTGTYSKPSTGIPKSDLASAVQTSLGKADTALQSYTEQYKGTITGVSANGTSVATSGVANIPAASTSAYGVTKLSSATNSTSTSLAATASAVKAAYDLANSYKGTVTGVKINGTTKNPSSGVVDLGTVITAHQDISGKQDKLVSGTNIKTINGESILGSGNLTISGGNGGGEDIRYFTEFTVEDFIEACEIENIITNDTTELFNAMKSNKVICVPYRGYDKGFIVASYKSGEDEEYPSMYLQKGDVEYSAWTGDDYSLYGGYPVYNTLSVIEVEVSSDGDAFIECYDNRLYKITEPVNAIFTSIAAMQKFATIQFVSKNSGTTITTYGEFLWANGEMPPIEPHTWYEFSVTNNINNAVLCVLTPFKPVEQ